MAASTVDECSGCFILAETVNNIVRHFGYTGVLCRSTVFQVDRFSSKKSHPCDLCFPVIVTNWPEVDIPICMLSPKTAKLRFPVNIEKVCQDLLLCSNNWVLPITACRKSESALCLLFDRTKAYEAVFQQILSKDICYGTLPHNGKNVYISKDDSPESFQDMDLCQLRKELAYKAILNIYTTLGFCVFTEKTSMAPMSEKVEHLHLTCNSNSKQIPPESCVILCGTVLDPETKAKNTQFCASQYYRNKEEYLRVIAKNKCDVKGDEKQIKLLAEAEAIAELLFVKLHDHVTVTTFGEIDHKGATFLLYNHVRLLTIRQKYEQNVANGLHPELPPVKSINFNLLTQEEEWEILLLLLRYPLWLRACVNDVGKGKASPHPILIGLDKLCRVVSVYYRRVRILTEPRPHLLPTMYARLCLIRCVEAVLQRGLALLDIKTLTYM